MPPAHADAPNAPPVMRSATLSAPACGWVRAGIVKRGTRHVGRWRCDPRDRGQRGGDQGDTLPSTLADPACAAQRAEAKRLFSEAAWCLSAAADARARGDNKAAASAAAEAADLRARSEAANAAARDDIFRRRNAASTSAFHVDLHGLHVAEALDKAVQVLDHALRNPQDPLAGTHVVRVMTGRGTHSGATGAALLPAVHDLLAGCHLRKHVKAESGGGVFAVSLPPPLAARTRAADLLPRAAAAALEKARARRSAL